MQRQKGHPKCPCCVFFCMPPLLPSLLHREGVSDEWAHMGMGEGGRDGRKESGSYFNLRQRFLTFLGSWIHFRIMWKIKTLLSRKMHLNTHTQKNHFPYNLFYCIGSWTPECNLGGTTLNVAIQALKKYLTRTTNPTYLEISPHSSLGNLLWVIWQWLVGPETKPVHWM